MASSPNAPGVGMSGVREEVALDGLTKSFSSAAGTIHAVRGVDVSIARGETVALLGLNGAGKSTTIEMVLVPRDAASCGRRPADHLTGPTIGRWSASFAARILRDVHKRRRQQMSDTATSTTGKLVWFELPADDPRRAQDFYGRLFGWRFESLSGPSEYHLATDAGGAIVPANGEKGPVVYFSVPDIDGAILRVRELGGVAGVGEEIPGLGVYAPCADTEGNRFSLWQGA